MKLILSLLGWLSISSFVGAQSSDNRLLNSYPSIVEKLIFYKKDKIKVFYGGPVDRKNKNAVRWVMLIEFDDYSNKTRAVYEVAFVNCDVHDAKDAEILFVEASDINIKFKNTLTPDYSVFSSLLNGEYSNGKYIVIRFAEISNFYYPDIYIHSEYGRKLIKDKDEIVTFLHEQLHTQNIYQDCYKGDVNEDIYSENDYEVVFTPIEIAIVFDEKPCVFLIEKRILKNDIWKVYYIISRKYKQTVDNNNDTSDYIALRIDSGCVSGQIYNDNACDCLDQLHDALENLANDNEENGIIIHIPTQDGRGFGTAPKAETEIYKKGGQGRVYSTLPLDTISAARLLYGVDNFDIRSFDGTVQILKSMKITKVSLLTDSVEKVAILQKNGIEVIRRKTGTNKVSCLNHILAKKGSPYYFSE